MRAITAGIIESLWPYYCLDEEGPALRYFEKALKARPGDKDTQEYIDDCRRRLALPRFGKNFRERTQEAWAAFSQIEAELRQIMDTDKTHQRGEELVEKCGMHSRRPCVILPLSWARVAKSMN